MTTEYVLELTDSELARYTMMATRARRDEGELWAAAGIKPGARVADIGCGPGAVAAELADVVGPTGSVVAVDNDADALARARDAAALRARANLTVRCAEAAATGIEPGSCDVVVVRHVLAHNGGHERGIVEHAASLLRPHGALFVVDVDLTAQRWLPVDADLADLQDRYVALHRSRGNDPTVGLRLGQLLASAGLDRVEHRGWYAIIPAGPDTTPPAWVARDALVSGGFASTDDVARWQAAVLGASEREALLFVSMFAAIGRMPAPSYEV